MRRNVYKLIINILKLYIPMHQITRESYIAYFFITLKYFAEITQNISLELKSLLMGQYTVLI